MLKRQLQLNARARSRPRPRLTHPPACTRTRKRTHARTRYNSTPRAGHRNAWDAWVCIVALGNHKQPQATTSNHKPTVQTTILEPQAVKLIQCLSYW